MNPTISDVEGAFAKVAVNPRSIQVDRTGIPLPAGGHFQGIQRLSGAHDVLVITSSSDSVGYCLLCDMDSNGQRGRARSPVVLDRAPFAHAGGCQLVDRTLVVGLENSSTEDASRIQFWNLGATPPARAAATIPRGNIPHFATAGAVGMTSYGAGAVLAVATFNADTVDFYFSEGEPRQGSPFRPRYSWSRANADKTGWIDPNFGHYQNINLLTETGTGHLYMVAFNLSIDGNWMDLFRIDLDAGPVAVFKKVGKKRMNCTDGCTFNDGAGIDLLPPGRFAVYAVNGHSGEHASGTTINVNWFPST